MVSSPETPPPGYERLIAPQPPQPSSSQLPSSPRPPGGDEMCLDVDKITLSPNAPAKPSSQSPLRGSSMASSPEPAPPGFERLLPPPLPETAPPGYVTLSPPLPPQLPLSPQQPPPPCPPPLPEMGQMVCGICRELLSYPRGARNVQCPCCKTVNFVLEAHEVGNVKCGKCRTLLMYPYGASSVRCSCCRSVTAIGVHNKRPPVSVHQGQLPPPPNLVQ